MRRFDFNKVIMESSTPPRDTNMLWIDIQEGTGKILFLREFKNGKWTDIAIGAETLLNATNIITIYEKKIVEVETQITELQDKLSKTSAEQEAEKARLQAQIQALQAQLASMQNTVQNLQSASGDSDIISFLKSANGNKGAVLGVRLRESTGTTSGSNVGRGKYQQFMFKPATLSDITTEFNIESAADMPSASGKFYQVVSPITAIPSELLINRKSVYIKFIYNANGSATLTTTGWKLYGTTEATVASGSKYTVTNKGIRLVIDDYMDSVFAEQFVQRMVGTAFS